MRKISKTVIAVFVVLMIVFAATGCDSKQDNKDEINVIINLDIKEDIGLFLTQWTVNGQTGGSGCSNADRSFIKRNDILSWTFDRQFMESPAETAEVTLSFIVVTEYFEPDYSFDYPEEYKIPMDAISFTAAFGETYYVSVTGDKTNGYSAVLENN
ncbi:MAG: hypothetical protein IJL30_06635 [Clostridia bacterium]|nr:hypothetical protein [Clostridia bacterium]